MPRYGITYEEVAQAAEGLLQQQRNPTLESVREYLGDTGSFATLSKHLNTWRQNRLLASTHHSLPVTPPDEVSKAVNHVWQQLNEKAQQEIAKLKEEQEKELQELKTAHDALVTENKQYQEQLKKIEIENSQLKADVELLQAGLREEKRQKIIFEEQYKAKVMTLESIIEEKEKALPILIQQTEKRIGELESQYNAREQSYHLEQDRMLRYQEEQRQRYIVEIDKLKVANIQLEKTHVQLAIENKHSKAKLELLEEQLREYQVDLKMMQHKNQQLIEEKNDYLVHIGKLDTELRQTYIRVDELTKQLEFAQQILIQKLEEQIKKATKNRVPKSDADPSEIKLSKES